MTGFGGRIEGARRWMAAAAVGAMALAAPLQAETLTDALIQSYENSPLLDQQRALLRVQDEGVATAVSRLRPTLNFQAQYSKSLGEGSIGVRTGATLNLILDWTVLDGGQRYLRIGAAKEAVLAARHGLTQVEQQVLLNAVSAYLTLRRNLLIVDARESNVRLITQQLRAAEDRFEVGEVTRTDVSISEARLAGARSQLAAARGDVDVAREQYRLAIGELPTGTLAALPPAPEIPPSVERAQRLALQINPAILGLQHEVTAARLLVGAAEADRLPTVDFQASAGQRRNDQSSAVVALQGNVPIYNGGRLSSQQRQAQANLDANRAQLAQQSRQVVNAVGQAYAILQVSRAQIVASREQVRSAQLAFEGFREEAQLGARTTLDVLDAEQELLDARTALLEAQADAQFAVYGVLSEIGLLTVDHLGLRVERYDPSLYYRAVADAPAVSPVGTDRGGRLDRVLRRFKRQN